MVFPDERALNGQLCKQFYVDAAKGYMMDVEVAAGACQLVGKEAYYCLNGTTTANVSGCVILSSLNANDQYGFS